MNTTVIHAENVSKRFWQNEHRPSLRHEAISMIKRFIKGRVAPNQNQTHQFWALRDVSFTIRRGETVGLVGRNGAGKSTLFRILAGITIPTVGDVTVQGRCAALIALGTGFHPERTGRENIYLSAALYGLRLNDIRELVPAIIDFAELGEFIDMPIKRYSSGMAARLGFSVAIHILPDVMLIDEALAVGDAAFQAKCIERIKLFKAEGRTIVVASHSHSMIREMCERTLWLAGGRLVGDGATGEILERYESL
jgi:lipopolysaccharide transport system ATP-binding protein